MRRLDDWLIDQVFQKIADWFCLHVGWNCFLLARGCRVAFGIGLFCEVCWIDIFWFMRFLNFALGAFWLFCAVWQPDPPSFTGCRNIIRAYKPSFVLRTFTSAFGKHPVDTIADKPLWA